jgi:hypothetical protein
MAEAADGQILAQSPQPQASNPIPKAGGTFAPKKGEPPIRSDVRDPVRAMKDCMDAWDAGTSMSKREWEATCKRTLNAEPTIDGLGQAQPKKKKNTSSWLPG